MLIGNEDSIRMERIAHAVCVTEASDRVLICYFLKLKLLPFETQTKT